MMTDKISFSQSVNSFVNRMSRSMALFSGASFLALSIFITVDVASRSLGGPFSGVSDEIASYILAWGGTWALASALVQGRHIRIDVLLHVFPERAREILFLGGLCLFTIYSGLLAWEMWGVTIASWKINALPSGSILGLPLAYIQGLASIGLSALVIQAFFITIKMIHEFSFIRRNSSNKNGPKSETYSPGEGLV